MFQYAEAGKHSKGHSTKGSHDIHKKDEYEKNVEFFEEDHAGGEEEKHGGFHHEHDGSKVITTTSFIGCQPARPK